MAGPAFVRAGARSQSASAASISPSKPTLGAQSGLLLCVVTSKNNATHSCATSGWALVTQVNSGANFTASLWRALEAAGAPTITWTGAAACSAQIAYYAAPDAPMDTTLGTPSSSTGTASPHTSAGITTARDNALAVLIDVAAANSGPSTPAGWTGDLSNGSGTDAGYTYFGSKPVATAGTGTGSISVAGAAAAWVQLQIELDGTVANNDFEVSKAEVAALYRPPSGFSAAKAEVAALYRPPAGFAVSKAEVGAILRYVGTSGRRRQMIVC